MTINKRLLTIFLIVLVSACKEQLDLGVKEPPKLTGLLKQIRIKNQENILTYTLDYDLEKKKWTGYTVSYSAAKTSTKEKVSYENGRMDYYSKQLFQPDGSFTFPEARIYNIEGANLIGVVNSHLTKNDLNDKSRGSSLQVRDRVSPTEPHLPCCRNWTAGSLFSSQKSARS